MSRKQIEAMIPLALQKVKIFVDNGTVESKYMSAIANFGVSVLQSGKHATKLFYDAKSDKRNKIPTIVKDIINTTHGTTKPFIEHTKEDILDATTALKLAIRTYKKVDNKDEAKTAKEEVQDE